MRIGDQTVYVVASALAVVVTLYSPSRRGFSTLAVHDLSLLGLEKPSFLLNPVRAEVVVEQGACSKVIAFGEVLRAVRGESVWGEDTTPSVPEVKERRAGSVPEVLLRATASQGEGCVRPGGGEKGSAVHGSLVRGDGRGAGDGGDEQS